MTATVLVSGRLWRDPESKVTKAGKPYATGTIRDIAGNETFWWKLLCFSESGIEELLSLRDGDGIAASGSFKAEPFEGKDGPRVGFTIFADRVISAKKQKRERDQQRRVEEPQAPGVTAQGPIDGDLNDEVPF
jgi:hypothetical protein